MKVNLYNKIKKEIDYIHSQLEQHFINSDKELSYIFNRIEQHFPSGKVDNGVLIKTPFILKIIKS